ncbi:MAG TPA: hypothetical protein VI386_08375 [Candidatus Sulfotelmatobacter sp.]
MNCRLLFAIVVISGLALLTLNAVASPREVALPAGTLLQCTLNEPNFSSTTVDVGDPVLCHLRSVSEFGQQAFPRGSYLVGHLESAKDPGHFVGKGSLKLQFDRIGLPSGDLPLEAKVIATRSYRVDREGKIIGHGHPRRDVVEWMLPPLWPWKVIMLPARGPRPKLKGETTLQLRLMDDVIVPQLSTSLTPGLAPGWRYFGRQQSQAYPEAQSGEFRPTLALRAGAQQRAGDDVPKASYAIAISRDTDTPRTTTANSARLISSTLTSAAPGLPVFVLKTGTVLSVGNYSYRDNRITYTLASGGDGVISGDEVDWTTTTRVNSARGVHMTLRAGHVPSATPGL